MGKTKRKGSLANQGLVHQHRYTPSFALAVLGVVLFGISGIVHTFQVVRYRTWYFLPVAVGAAMEVVGYAFRALSSKKDPYAVVFFVVQYFFIVVAPVLFSAAIYTVLSMLIEAVGREHAPLRPRLILVLFIASDVVATAVQVVGAASIGVAESGRKDPTTANHVLLAGLAFQVCTFFVFLTLLAAFLARARKVVPAAMLPFTAALVLAALLVYLRTCFRLAETAQGLMQALSSHEVYFGCLEFAPIILALLLFNVWHPGKWVPRYS